MGTDLLLNNIESLAEESGLKRVFEGIKVVLEPAISFKLVKVDSGRSLHRKSHLGGIPDLPDGFLWPAHNGQPLDFLIQINLEDVKELDVNKTLPDRGMLSFFYDTEEQPWGYDPEDLDGFKVVYFKDLEVLFPREISEKRTLLPTCGLEFKTSLTVPSTLSRTYEKIEKQIGITEDESDRYSEFVENINSLIYVNGGQHRLLGHSANLQGDMQLEAQLVSSGIYCGDAEGYRTQRAKELEGGADDWRMLLQLDSDDEGDLTWGDAGMIYFWIRRQDLESTCFDNVWMTLQCC
jgi:uncharacterized protein YwqG